jgi:hypothetical protein
LSCIKSHFLGGIAQIASLASLTEYTMDTASLLVHSNEAVNEATSPINQPNEANEAIKPIPLKILKNTYFYDFFIVPIIKLS